jgi:cytochrome oxidase Cu insertion factor (SCO1/SenC/PrrC family)
VKMTLVAIFLLTSVSAHAGYFQSPVNEASIKNIDVKTENGSDAKVSDLVQKSKSLVLAPAYFSCNSTCPLLAENLRDSISSSKVSEQTQVVFLSFNPSDDTESMKMFRDHHKLPSKWVLGVAKSESDAKDLFNRFGYQFQKTADGFDHPNSAFVFSKEKTLWTGMLVGVDNKPDDIERAVGEANYAELNGPTQKLVQYLSKPEYLIVIGFFGIVFPLILIIFILFRKNRRLAETSTT